MEMDTTDLIARARAGDHNAFRDLVQGHSHELQVHCYRILGSLQDAEDALQETLVSAWRNLGQFGERSSLRTWLYQIATNRCLSMLRADSRRPRIAPLEPLDHLPEPTGAGDAPPWLEPYPDVLLDHLADQRPGPEARYETTEAISLAFITALQLLPPRQRAALVLRDVLGYHAAEAARMLDTTQESVQSALKRARATVDSHLADSGSGGTGGSGNRRPARRLDTAAEQRGQRDPLGVPGVLVFVEQHHPVAGPQVLADLGEGRGQPSGRGHLRAEVHHLGVAHPFGQRVEQRHQLGALGLSGQQPQQPLAGATLTLIGTGGKGVDQPLELDVGVVQLGGVHQVFGQLTPQPQHHRGHRGGSFVGAQFAAVTADHVESQLPQFGFAEQAGVGFHRQQQTVVTQQGAGEGVVGTYRWCSG